MSYIEDAFKIYTDNEFAGLPKDTIVDAMTIQARDAFYNGVRWMLLAIIREDTSLELLLFMKKTLEEELATYEASK